MLEAARATGLAATAITFDPHPRIALGNRVELRYASGSIGVQAHPRVLFYTELVGVIAASREEILVTDGGLLVTVHHRVIFDVSGRVTLVGTYRSAGVALGMTAMLATGKRVREWLAKRPTRPER